MVRNGIVYRAQPLGDRRAQLHRDLILDGVVIDSREIGEPLQTITIRAMTRTINLDNYPAWQRAIREKEAGKR